ncbi:class II aldolase/adducin family protein [Pontibacter qinzhouensis]|uniref:Class II aldolase/adducin family protein n=1 Tax=Pontibacter qinzhouensis TaxID=2603253 RepID=A0A5C8KEF0_9BACT|nr:class II aldolase/adducin family protein [Pontibacter qinzhouensis]TXK52607.1 class II aldolase/adducin family protein [Pontibacter qinzhouensis]
MKEVLNTQLLHPREQIALIMGRIYKRGLTTTSGGNISLLDENGDIWISPAGVDKGALQPSDIMCVKKDGTVVGPHRPSSEFPFHKAIYQIRPDIKAIVHAHPPALVSFSIVRAIPRTNVISQAKHVCGPIGYAPYELPGSAALGAKIAEEFLKGFKAVIMENHGTVVGGADMMDAFQRFETLEFSARALLYGKQVGEPTYLSDEEIDAFEMQIPHLLPEMEEVSHPSDEREKRKEICKIVHRACNHGLMISSYGTVSVRWRDNDFLITPTGVPRWDIQLEDIVLIKDGKREPGKMPSRTTYLHQEIYARHPEINSIILTQSPYLMAFAVTGAPFNVRTIPESWIFLQDVPSLPFGIQFKGRTEIPEILSPANPAVIIRNDSVLVTGDKLLQTFDKLEVAEFSAKSLVMCAPLGNLVPISNEQVEALRAAFLA